MKKLLTTLVLFSALLFLKSYAQTSTTGCNPGFTFQFTTGTTVKLNPTLATDSPYVQHYWIFGDGSAASTSISPLHIYAPGVYMVKHFVVRRNPNGVIVCRDSLFKPLTIAHTNCTLTAAFTSASPAPLQAVFTNTSTGFTPGDSIRWTFGDGTVSYSVNPTHQYVNAGTYNVCLRVKKAANSATTAPCVSEVCHTVILSLPPTYCSLVANFTWYQNTTGISLYSYQFTNTSIGSSSADSIRWTFGDGTSSNQNNPTHVYAVPGTYNVCIRIIKRTASGTLTDCVREKCYNVVVPPAINPCNLQVYFTTLTGPQNVISFTNQSSGYSPTDSIKWNFGDGTTSTVINPTHSFATAGTYNVCLTIKKNTIAGSTPCIRTYCKTVVITNTCTLVANFTYYRDSAAPNLYTYHFNNTSAPLNNTDSIRWTFGDGTSSSQLNPTHGYNAPGVYNVCLRIIKRNPNGVLTNCVAEKCYTITVAPACTLQANYTRTVSSTNYKTINFINTSNATPNTATATWYFGDGSTATTWNATHTYNLPGSYNVCLRVQSGSCVSYKCDSVRVIAPPPSCMQLSAYSFTRAVTNNNIIIFTPEFIGNDVQYTWTFGDGTGAQTATATHQFAAVGNYTVCLTAYRNNGCASTTCKTISISSTINCNNITLNFNDVRDPLVPNRVTFIPTSNTTITSQLWTITKLPTTPGTGSATIQSNNPTYVFLDSGYYSVCVRATFVGGCIKTFCRTIHIAHPMPFTTTCNLQVYPNPATNYANANITLAQPLQLNAYVFNSMNMLVAQKQQQGFVGTNVISIYTGNLPSGIYSYRVVYGNQTCSTNFVRQ